MDSKYNIKVAAKLTKLSPNLIRAWERRYNAVTPTRSSTNRRLYSDSDIKKLKLLKEATEKGLNIGSVADLSIEKLQTILDKNEVKNLKDNFYYDKYKANFSDAEYNLGNCFEAIEKIDPSELHRALRKAALYMNDLDLARRVIKPLLIRVSELSNRGIINKLQENMVFNISESFLNNMIKSFNLPEKSPKAFALQLEDKLNKLSSLLAVAIYSIKGMKIDLYTIDNDFKSIKEKIYEENPTAVILSNIFPENREMINDTLVRLSKETSLLKKTNLLLFTRNSESQTNLDLEKIKVFSSDNLNRIGNDHLLSFKETSE